MRIASPDAALIEPFVPEPSDAVPKAVGRAAAKVPVGPSESVRASTSPVVRLVTVTSSVPSPARSGSVTESWRSVPTWPATMDGVPGVPPEIVSVACTVAGAPGGRAVSA